MIVGQNNALRDVEKKGRRDRLLRLLAQVRDQVIAVLVLLELWERAETSQSSGRTVKWDKTSGGDVFPHLYADLEGEYVVGLKVIEREEEEKGGWESTLRKLEEDGWMEY